MGRRRGSFSPSVLKTKATRPKWYIRVSDPRKGSHGESSHYLGFADRVSREDAESAARAVVDRILAEQTFHSATIADTVLNEIAVPELPSRTSATGDAAELVVCADLVGRGYEVYRPTCTKSSCDLIARINGRLVRVEVKSGNTKHGRFLCSLKRNAGKFDVAALLAKSGVIYYIPASGLSSLVNPRIDENRKDIGGIQGASTISRTVSSLDVAFDSTACKKNAKQGFISQ